MASKSHSKRSKKSQGLKTPKAKKNAATKNSRKQVRAKAPTPKARQKAIKKNQLATKKKTKAAIKKSTRKPHIIKVKSQKGRSFKEAAKFFKKLGVAFQRTDLSKLKKAPTKSQAAKIKKLQNSDIFKLDKKTASKYRKIGEKVSNKGVLVEPKKKGTRRYAKGERIVEIQKTPEGTVRKETIPLEYHNLEQWFKDARNSPELQERYGNRVAFRFFGNYTEVIDTLEGALERLYYYQTVQEAINSGDAKYQNLVFKNIELIKVKPGIRGARQYESAYERYRQKYQRHKRKRERERANVRLFMIKERNPARYQSILEKKRAANKRAYLRRKNDPTWLEKHRANARAYYKRTNPK